MMTLFRKTTLCLVCLLLILFFSSCTQSIVDTQQNPCDVENISNSSSDIFRHATDLLLAIVAVSALIISLRTIKTDETKTISETISKTRIEWLNNLRKDISIYIEKYIEKENHDNRNDLLKSQMSIELYLSKNVKIYAPFQDALTRCTEEPYSEDNLKMMVEKAQELQNDVWQRIKMESGISQKAEKAIKSSLKKKRHTKGNSTDNIQDVSTTEDSP